MDIDLLSGYLGFVSLLFLPGLATLLVFNQTRNSNLITILARSYGISLALNALLMFVAMTSAQTSFATGFVQLTGIGLASFPTIIVVTSALVVIVAGAIRLHEQILRYQFKLPGRIELASLFLGLVFTVLVLSQFVKYPIFPKSFSIDFLQHYRLTQDLIAHPTAGSQALLYYGVHYNLALGYLLVGGNPFIQIQYLMALLVAPSSLIFFEAAKRLYNSKWFALLCQLIFIGTGFLWYIPLYDTGLYPNLFSIIVSLAFLVELQGVMNGGSWGGFPGLVIVAGGLFLSHYFAPLFVVAVAISLLLGVSLKMVSWKKASFPLAIMAAPLVGLISNPGLVNFALATLRESRTTGAFSYSTPLADSFAFSFFLKYSIAGIYNYASIILIFGIPLSVYYIWKNRRESWLLSVLPLWFVLLWITAPNGELSWRFAFEGLAPLLLLAPATFSVAPRFVRWILGVRPRKAGMHRDARREEYSLTDIAIIIIMLLMVGVGSWTIIMLGDLTSNTGSYSAAQSDLYDSMTWFVGHTPATSSLLSVTDWRIAFLNPITGRTGQLLLLAPGPDTIAYAKKSSYDYILVTYFIPATVPPTLDLTTYYNSFSQNQNLTVVYQNQYDVIYQVK